MSDQALEQLRRRWDDGDLESRVRCLREGVRAGVLAELLTPALSAWFSAHPEVARACVGAPS